MKTIISVCRPPGATSSRLDGPSEKVQTSKHELILPAGVREATEPRIQGRTAGQSAVGDLSINADSKTKLSIWRRETSSLLIGLVPILTICLEGLGWTRILSFSRLCWVVTFWASSMMWIFLRLWFGTWILHDVIFMRLWFVTWIVVLSFALSCRLRWVVFFEQVA